MRSHVRRYVREGVSHAMRSGLIGTHTPAVCGRSPLWFDPRGWRGTAPEEIESNAANQRCKACVRAVGDQW